MKKLLILLTVMGILFFGSQTIVKAQGAEETNTEAVTETANDEVAKPAPVVEDPITPAFQETSDAEETAGFHQTLKQKFIEGGPEFMGIILVTLIFGLALAIERIIYLNLATSNTKKLLKNVEDALSAGGIEQAKNVCRDTKGPVAAIFYQGMERADEGLEMIEKSVVSYGSVQMGRLESGLSWISLFISLAPMLGFMGTVIGMIQAFDNIAAAGDISPQIVADGIKVALLTTVFGLIVAIILQIFYNYLVAKIDALVNNMEDASISLIDLLAKYNKKN